MNHEKESGEFVSNKMFSFTMVPNVILFDPFLDCETRAIYINLLCRAMVKGWSHPSIARIAKEVGLSDNTVKKRLKLLQEFGLVEIKYRQDERGFQSNLYIFIPVREVYGDDLTNIAFPSSSEIELKVGVFRRKILMRLENEKSGGVANTSEGGGSPDAPGGGSPDAPGWVTRCSRVGHQMPTNNKKLKKQNETNEAKEKENPSTSSSGLSLISSKPKIAKFDQQDLQLAKDWLQFAIRQMNGRKYDSWTEEKFAAELAKVRIKTGFNHDGMREVFNFVSTDDFWGKNAISPATLTSMSKNGLRKIDNIWQAVKGGAKFKSARMMEKSEQALENSTYQLPF